MGRPVVVFIGKNFPASQIDLNKVSVFCKYWTNCDGLSHLN